MKYDKAENNQFLIGMDGYISKDGDFWHGIVGSSGDETAKRDTARFIWKIEKETADVVTFKDE